MARREHKVKPVSKYLSLDPGLLREFEDFVDAAGLRQGTVAEAALFFIMRIPGHQRDALIRALMVWKDTDAKNREPLAYQDAKPPTVGDALREGTTSRRGTG